MPKASLTEAARSDAGKGDRGLLFVTVLENTEDLRRTGGAGIDVGVGGNRRAIYLLMKLRDSGLGPKKSCGERGCHAIREGYVETRNIPGGEIGGEPDYVATPALAIWPR